MLYILLSYFAVLYVVSRLVARKSTDSVFYRGDRQSPWYLVAFGMVGASISGVSFVSVPGMVLRSGMTYLEVCTGFIIGYFVVAYVLLPIYYKNNLTTIYEYLRHISDEAYKVGSLFFVISKLLGAAAKFYVPCFIISRIMDWNFSLTVVGMLLLVWAYTRRGGIKSLVWTDTVQTLCMMVCLLLIIWGLWNDVGAGNEVSALVGETARRLDLSIFSTPKAAVNVVSGIFIVIVMTGLDQDMMQKNLTCRTLRDAQKDMCSYGFAFLPVNALFLGLGVLLAALHFQQGSPLPDKADELLTSYCIQRGGMVLTLFMLGIVATSFSTVDSALTALTTTICTMNVKRKRSYVHLFMAAAMAVCCILFDRLNTTSLIDAVYTLVSYTYGPLLGLFSFVLTRRHIRRMRRYGILTVCLLSPLLCLLLAQLTPLLMDYSFGYELLLINGLLTYGGLWLMQLPEKQQQENL